MSKPSGDPRTESTASCQQSAKHETETCRAASESRDGVVRWSPRAGEGTAGAVELRERYVVKAPAGAAGKATFLPFSPCTRLMRHLSVLASRMAFSVLIEQLSAFISAE